jgi:hypothetical protein
LWIFVAELKRRKRETSIPRGPHHCSDLRRWMPCMPGRQINLQVTINMELVDVAMDFTEY